MQPFHAFGLFLALFFSIFFFSNSVRPFQQTQVFGSGECHSSWEVKTYLDHETARLIEDKLQLRGFESRVDVYQQSEIDGCGNSFEFPGNIFIDIQTGLQSELIDGELATVLRAAVHSVANITISSSYTNTNFKSMLVWNPNLGIHGQLIENSQQAASSDSIRANTELHANQATYNKKVLVVVYDPLLSNGKLLSDHMNWHEHETLTSQTIDFFKQASNQTMQYSVAETIVLTDGWPKKADGFTYSEEEYLGVMNGTVTPHNPDRVDYNAILADERLDICTKVNNNQIDEVWIYNGPYFGFYESTLAGPNGYLFNSSPITGPNSCDRLIPIMGPSPERDISSAVHNFGHRTEATLSQVYGSWNARIAPRNAWEKFALAEFRFNSLGYSGCGHVHFPANGEDPGNNDQGYDYGNTGNPTSTNCDEFSNYPNLSTPPTLETVTCTEWGCTEYSFLYYWFNHLPRSSGCGPDSILADWWGYFANPAWANDPDATCPEVTPVPTATATPYNPNAPTSGSTQVDAKLVWQDTGILIKKNSDVFIEVTTGTWTHWQGVRPYNNGDGEGASCGSATCAEPMPFYSKGGLIGRVGDQIFAIGSSESINLPVSGILYLRINDPDNGLFDNDGVLTVAVQGPEPTDTPTFIPIPTDTSTFTPIPSDTPTLTPIPSHTPTFTLIPTDTPTLTPAPSDTPTLTPEPTDTPKSTSAPTTEPTIEPKPSDTPIFTLVPTQPTETNTPSSTAVNTPSPSETPNKIETPTAETSLTPTNIPPSSTTTITITPIPSETPTLTAVETPVDPPSQNEFLIFLPIAR